MTADQIGECMLRILRKELESSHCGDFIIKKAFDGGVTLSPAAVTVILHKLDIPA